MMALTPRPAAADVTIYQWDWSYDATIHRVWINATIRNSSLIPFDRARITVKYYTSTGSYSYNHEFLLTRTEYAKISFSFPLDEKPSSVSIEVRTD